ncbi:ATP-grasp domain-containing protein [Streptomyces coacervatus]|uniref:ATP-grasp domain-containing protein n=1 Tax=Streptomyces coacervatus TaxID=647381 RepID=A0ABP7H4C6_9ACTN|nr:ATP-grasp domain-containing protein [Streptomyces coacervatus]MDF2268127.1 ATP-grasp domain-containing protein [Streptomyces coacervatus]
MDNLILGNLKVLLRSTPEEWLAATGGTATLVTGTDATHDTGWLTQHYGSAFAAIHAYPNYTMNDSVLKRVDEIVSRGSFRRIIAMSEADVMRAALLRERHGIPGLTPDQAIRMRDKYLMKESLKDHGIPIPRYRKVRNALDVSDFVTEVGYPIVLKPVCGAGSMHTYVIESEQELDEVLAAGYFSGFIVDKMPELLAEEFIHGQQYRIDGFYADGKCQYITAARLIGTNLEFMNGRHFANSLLDAGSELSRQIVSFAQNILENALPFGREGMFHMEIWQRPDGEFVFGEVGARLGGISIFEENRFGFEVDYKMAAVRALCGLGTPDWPSPEKLQKRFAGHVVISPRAGFLEEVPSSCPFDWVLDYKHKPAGQRYSLMRGSNDEVAMVMVAGSSEEEVEKRLQEVAQWFYDNTVWAD